MSFELYLFKYLKLTNLLEKMLHFMTAFVICLSILETEEFCLDDQN